MKRIIAFVLMTCLILGLCACGDNGGKSSLKVGFSRVSILPDGSECLGGGDASSRNSQGYLDETAATCIAITEGEETVLIYTLDLLTVGKLTYSLQDSASEATGIPTENIILNCTHTHSGVSVTSRASAEYMTKIKNAIADAATQAIADQSPAEIYYGDTQTENLCYVRHYILENGTHYGTHQGSKYKGTQKIVSHAYDANNTMQVIKFARAAEDKKDIVLMNLGAHPNLVSQSNRYSLSADWPGYARAYVEENTDTLCAVFQAASGDQGTGSSVFGGYDTNKFKEHGAEAGRYCVEILNGDMTKAEGSGVKLSIKEYTGKSMKEGLDDTERMAQATNIKSLQAQYGSSHVLVDQAVAAADLIDSKYEAMGLAERQDKPDTYTINLHALQAGGVSFIFAPYEMFGGSSKYIVENSPYDMTFIVTCSETPTGHAGYIPTEYGCENSFYEYDVTSFERGTAEKLAETYVEMLTDIKNAG